MDLLIYLSRVFRWSGIIDYRVVPLVTIFSAIGPLQHSAFCQRLDPSIDTLIKETCVTCHNSTMRAGDLDLGQASPGDYVVWEKVLGKLRAGTMPPSGVEKPPREELDRVTSALAKHLETLEKQMKPNPGSVTARRLNRVEYNNTVRDLLGVDLKPAHDFPVDDSGYGFDNIGDVLTISPVLMEKYLAAAETIASASLKIPPIPKPASHQYKMTSGQWVPVLIKTHRFPAEGEYVFSTGVNVIPHDTTKGVSPLELSLRLDGVEIQKFWVDKAPLTQRVFDYRHKVSAGEHRVEAVCVGFVHDPEFKGSRLHIDGMEIRGPYDPEMPKEIAGYKKVFVCGHPRGKHPPACRRIVVQDLVRRAFRRPPTLEEVNSRERLVAEEQHRGKSLEAAMQVAIRSVLVSPQFLFRIERGHGAGKLGGTRQLGDFELASRLSYFLWSSMPDEELFQKAQAGSLMDPEVLAVQVRRMLQDPKCKALVDNFAGQWLQLRNLEMARPDPERFPYFDEGLRAAMQRETELFFQAVIQENRSILDFIDGKFTFVNQRLAKHYGIEGVTGAEFRRITLDGDQRSGIFTQASLLTVTSYPTRTSPVLRGKWLLGNVLGAPPPPPPPGAGKLNEEEIGTAASLRAQLEKHRAKPSCSGCHSQMDPLGFGLENYDPIGAWRSRDGNFPVDTTGTLPDGRSFQNPREFKGILKAQAEDFAICLTEKLMTYALGRGVEAYDRPTVRQIVRKVGAENYRFQSLILEIVKSGPFQTRRAD